MTTILILAIAGIVLILFEMVLPGGILGVIGTICLIAVVVMTFVNYGTGPGLAAFGGLVVFGGVAMWAWMRYFDRLPFTKTLILRETAGKVDGAAERQSLVGATGEALTDLMPSGRAQLGETRVDVISKSGPIDKGAKLEVVDVQGPSVIVVEV